MKTLFDSTCTDEIVQRISMLNEESKALWGKMNNSQMAKHCTIWNDWVLGNGTYVYKQEFIGFLFGKMALKSNTKNDKPIGKNMPAGKYFIVKDTNIELATQKNIWIQQIHAYKDFSNDSFIHDFFGKMTKEQIGIFAYKHNDHHLRQFKL